MSDQKIQEYCLGFIYYSGSVLLMLRTRGWNGIRGKLEPGETPIEAMKREAEEGVSIPLGGSELEWERCGQLRGTYYDTNPKVKGYSYVIHCFSAAVSVVHGPVTSKDPTEPVSFFGVDTVYTLRRMLAPNLIWLLELCHPDEGCETFTVEERP